MPRTTIAEARLGRQGGIGQKGAEWDINKKWRGERRVALCLEMASLVRRPQVSNCATPKRQGTRVGERAIERAEIHRLRAACHLAADVPIGDCGATMAPS